jgi:hypothetical protein
MLEAFFSPLISSNETESMAYIPPEMFYLSYVIIVGKSTVEAPLYGTMRPN